jgi:hypothetical protein
MSFDLAGFENHAPLTQVSLRTFVLDHCGRILWKLVC